MENIKSEIDRLDLALSNYIIYLKFFLDATRKQEVTGTEKILERRSKENEIKEQD